MVNPTLVGKIASIAAALILIPTATFFVHRYVKRGKSQNVESKALVEGPYRLPQDVIPLHYEINIRTITQPKSFMGYVRIEIECKKPTKTVILHAAQLILFNDIKFYKSNSKKKIKVRKMDYSNNPTENPNDLLILYLSEELTPNSKYHFEIDFGGNLGPWFHESGFYLAQDHTQKAKDVATTCFFPSDARSAFPCFDEPSLKAEFTIKLGCDGGVQTVSNMPPIGTSRDSKGFLWQSFEKTPRISPHEVGFVIGELSTRSDSTPDGGFTLRTWTLPTSIGKIAFIRSIGLDIIEFYKTFFDVSSQRQLNLVVLPEIRELVRENYGLITVSEDELLLESEASSFKKYNAALMFSQKVAHQWMGCLATMKWWNEYWIIDSFAFFVRSYPLQKHFSELDPITDDLGQFLDNVLISDDDENASPLYIPNIEGMRAEQITRTVNKNHITTKKGALLFRMLYNSLGQDVFRAGIKAYLTKFSFKVSEQNDLWAAFNEVAQSKQVLPSGVTVKQIMETWIMQPGYPVIEVTNRNKGLITITYKRYLSEASSNPEVAQQCWWVPVKFRTANKPADTSRTQWLGCDPKSLTIDTGARAQDWIILNRDNGIFRVNYDSKTWEQLALALKGDRSRTGINEWDRVLLVSDALALANSGQVNYKNAFKMLSTVRQEQHYMPWYSALNHMQELENRLLRTEKYDSFKNMMKKLLGNIYSEVKKGQSGSDDDELYSLIQKWACKYEMGGCVDGLMHKFAEWKSNPDIEMGMEETTDVLCEGVKQGGEVVWNEVWELVPKASFLEKPSLLMALTCTTHQESFNKLLNSVLDVKVAQPFFSAIAYMKGFENRDGYSLILKFTLTNIDKVKDYLGDYLSSIFQMFGRKAVRQEDIDELKQFATFKPEIAAKVGMGQVLEEAEQKVAWLKNNLGTISDAMNAF